MLIVKKTCDLLHGDKVAEDIFKGNMLIIKSGVTIDDHIKHKLNKWQIPSICIEDTASLETDEQRNTWQEQDLRALFYELLLVVVNESRYGYALHSEEKIKWLEDMFVTCMSDSFVFKELMALKKWDSNSFYHSFNVFLLGTLLYRQIGKTDHCIVDYAKGCLLHDIGKSIVPQAILQKKGSVTPSEFELIKKHTTWGFDKIMATQNQGVIGTMAKSHHEKLDGSGYPEGLSGAEIIPEVRILTIVDMYSALTTSRSHRPPLSTTGSLKLLLNERDKLDYEYLIELMHLLGIYPPNAIVELSNGAKAEVLHVYEGMPYKPIVKRLDNMQTIELPSNLSLKVSRFLFK